MIKLLFDQYISEKLSPSAQCIAFSSNFGGGDALHYQYTFISAGICVLALCVIYVLLACKYSPNRYDWLKLYSLAVQEKVYKKSREDKNMEHQHIMIFLMYFVPPIITLGIIQTTNFTIGFCSAFVLALIFFPVDPGIHYGHNLGHELQKLKSIKPNGDELPKDEKCQYWDKKVNIKGEEGKPDTYKLVKSFHVRNLYQGPSSLTVAILVFAAQVLLTVFYCAAVWEGGRPCFQEPRQIFFYYMGNVIKGVCFLIIQDTVTDENMEVDRFYWRCTLWAIKHSKEGHSVTKCGVRQKNMNSEVQWKVRHWMSVFVNGYLRLLVFFLMSIQVSQSPDSMDFVLNIVAALFIFELDDHSTWGADHAIVRIESKSYEYPSTTQVQEEDESDVAKEMKQLANEINEKVKEWRRLEEKYNMLVQTSADIENQSAVEIGESQQPAVKIGESDSAGEISESESVVDNKAPSK